MFSIHLLSAGVKFINLPHSPSDWATGSVGHVTDQHGSCVFVSLPTVYIASQALNWGPGFQVKHSVIYHVTGPIKNRTLPEVVINSSFIELNWF